MKLWWDYLNEKMYASLSSLQLLGTVDMTVRDVATVELVTGYVQDGGSFLVGDIPAATTIVFAAKPTANLTETKLFIYQPLWTKTTTGNYTATLDLRSADLASLVDGSSSALDMTGEFLLVTDSGLNTHSTQFAIAMRKDVYRGSETIGAVVTIPLAGLTEEVRNGVKVLVLRNTDGVEYAAWGLPGSNV